MDRFVSELPPSAAPLYRRASEIFAKPSLAATRRSFVSTRVIPAASIWVRKTSALRFSRRREVLEGDRGGREQSLLRAFTSLLLNVATFVFVVHVETFRLWENHYYEALAGSIGVDLAHVFNVLYIIFHNRSCSSPSFKCRKICRRILHLRVSMDRIILYAQWMPVYTLGGAMDLIVLRVGGLVIRLATVFSCISAFKTLERSLQNQAARRLVNLLGLLLFLTYTSSCGYYALTCAGQMAAHTNTSLPVSKHQFSYSTEGQWRDLALATYFSVQVLFTIGYGDIVPQTLEEAAITCVFMCIAILFKAFFIASMTTILGNVDYSGSLFKRKMESVRRYMRRERLSPELQKKVETVFAFLWERQKGRVDELLLEDLPEPMLDMVVAGKGHWLFLIPFFCGRSRSFVQDLVSLLQNQVLTVGELLVQKGEACSNMYFLMSGMLRVLEYAEGRGKNYVIERLFPGQNGYIGEQLIFYARPIYTHTVDAARTSEVHRLSKEDLQQTIKKFRKLRQQGDKLARRLYKKRQGIGSLLCTLAKSKGGLPLNTNPGLGLSKGGKGPGQSMLKSKLRSTLLRSQTNEVAVVPPPLEHIHQNPKCDPGAAKTRDNYNVKLQDFQARSGSIISVDLNLGSGRILESLFAISRRTYNAFQASLQHSRLWTIAILAAHLICPLQGTKYMVYLTLACVGDALIFLDVFFVPRPFMLSESDNKSQLSHAKRTQMSRQHSGFSAVRESRSFWNCKIYLLAIVVSVVSLVLGFLEFRTAHFCLRGLGVACLYPACTDLMKRLHDEFHLQISLSQKVLVTFLLAFLTLEFWVSFGWVLLNDPAAPNSLLAALYWALVTSTGVGFGDIVAEDEVHMIYAIFVITTCAAVYISYLSTLVSLFKPPSVSEERIEHFDNCFDHFISQSNLEIDVKVACKQFRDYIKSQSQETVNDKVMFEAKQPASVMKTYRKELIEDALLKINRLFEDQEDELLRDVALALHHDIFFPSNVIFGGSSNENPAMHGLKRCMVFLAKGEACVMSPDKKEVRKVTTSMSFGEIELFRPGFTKNLLVATSICSVYYLTRGRFLAILEELEAQREDEEVNIAAEMEEKAVQLTAKLDESVRKNLTSGKLAKLKGGDSLEPPSRKKLAKFPVDSAVQKRWQVVESFAMLFHLLYLPYQFCFGFGSIGENISWHMVLNYLADVVSIVAMVLRYNYFQTTSELELAKVRRAYVTRTLYLDAFAVLPIDIVFLFIRTLSIQAYVIARSTRLARIYVLRGFIHSIESTDSLLSNVCNFAILLISVGTFAHWGGCGFFALARTTLLADSFNSSTSKAWVRDGAFPVVNLVVENNTKRLDMLPGAYSWSLYWSLTVITTVGYGDLHPVNEGEKLYAILLMLLAGVLYAMILSKLEEIVAASDVSSLIYQRKLDELRDYGKLRGLPKDLARELATYHKRLLNKNGGVDDRWILEKLPLNLRRRIIAGMGGRNFLNQVPFFAKNGHADVLLDLFRPVFYLPGTAVYLKGQVHQTLYIVSHGKVLLAEAGLVQVYKSFLAGNAFGQLEFFFDEPAPAMAITEAEATLLFIHKRQLLRFLRENRDIEELYDKAVEEAKAALYKSFSIEGFQKNLRSTKLAKLFTNAAESQQGVGRKLIPPDHLARVIWNSAMLGVFLFNCFFITYRMSIYFYDTDKDSAFTIFLAADIVCDVFQLCDMYLRAFHFAFANHGTVKMLAADSRRKYLRSFFVVDLFAMLPIQYVLLLFSNVYPIRNLALSRVNRAFYAVNILELLKSAERLLYRYSVLMRAASWNLVRMCMFAFAMVHLAACVYALLTFGSDQFAATKNPGNLYVVSLYWSFYTASTVGFGNLATPGPVFSSVCMIVGCFILDAGITATIGNMLSNEESRSDNGRYSRECLELYMQTRHIQKDVQIKVREYLEYHVTSGQSIVEKRLFLLLPEYYRTELARSVVIDKFTIVKTHPLFSDFDSGLIQTMATRLFPVTYPSGHVLLGDDPSLLESAGVRRSSKEWSNILSGSFRKRKESEKCRHEEIGRIAEDEEDLLGTTLNRNKSPFELSQVGNILFLISGTVIVKSIGKTRSVRSGIITGSSGIEAAQTGSLCHFFALSLESYVFLKKYAASVWRNIGTFEDLLSDNRGFKCVKRLCEDSVPELAIVKAWNHLHVYQTSSATFTTDANEQLLRNVRGALMDPKVTSYIFGSEVLSAEEEDFIDAMHTKVTVAAEDSKTLQGYLLRILENTVYPKFLISYEFYLFTLATEKERQLAGVGVDS